MPEEPRPHVLHRTPEGDDQLGLPGEEIRRAIRIPGRIWSCSLLHRQILPVSVLSARCSCGRGMFPIVNGEPAAPPAVGLPLFEELEEEPTP